MIATIRTPKSIAFAGFLVIGLLFICLMVVKDMNYKLGVANTSNADYQKMTDSQADVIKSLTRELEELRKAKVVEVENAEKSYTKRILQHQASGYSFTVVSPYYGNKTITYRGPNAIPHFFQSIEREEKKIRNWFYKNEHKMDKLTIEEEKDFRESQQCYLCKEEIFSNDWLEKNLADIVDDLNICNMNTKKFPSSSDISLKKKSVRRTMKIENNAVDKTR